MSETGVATRADVPSRSLAQRRYMAIAEHHPEQLRLPAPRMSQGQLQEFAATPEQGLPRHVKARAARQALVRGMKG